MNLVAIIPAQYLLATNAALATQGFGPSNFSVQCFESGRASHAALHAWHDAAFEAAVTALPHVAYDIGTGDPVAHTRSLIDAQGAKWDADAAELPNTGNVTAGSLCRYGESLWYVIQTHNRSTYGGDPAQYPALMRRARRPGVAEPWTQPLDSLDAYKLVNPFTGEGDLCTYAGKTRRVSQADGAGNNVWTPGQFGWIQMQ